MLLRLLLATLCFSFFTHELIGQEHVQLDKIGSYETNIFNLGAAEISAFHPGSQRLFFVNAANQSIDVLDASNPTIPTYLFSIDVSPFGANANSLVVLKDAIAAAVEAQAKQDPGKIVLWDINGAFVQELEVGALPDMLAVSSDENFLITANEGEPNFDYSLDPVGSVSVVQVPENLENLSQNDVTTLGFQEFEYRRASFGDEVDWPWAIEVTPPSFDLTQAFWGETSNMEGMSAVHGDSFWGGENLGEVIAEDQYAQITSNVISMNAFAKSISFHYFTQGFSVEDSLAYQIRFNGLPFENTDDAVVLNHNEHWTKMSIPVPSNTEVQIRIIVKQTSTAGSFGVDDLRVNHFDESVKVNGNFGWASVQQDFEPEYIAIAEDNDRAWISLQENNAFIELDLMSLNFTGIRGYGFKDHNDDDYGMDANDQDGVVNILPWPVLGLYQPDAIYTYEVDGIDYIVTANEGDVREYGDFVEDERLANLSLDPLVFPNANILQDNNALGRLKVNAHWGDLDLDGDLDQIYSFGARSFSIFTAEGELVFDTKSEFEELTGDILGDVFNANNDNNNSFDSRSDDKGPEPEGVVLGKINERIYAFIGLERVGGIMVYDVTSPAQASFVQYLNPRDFSSPVNTSEAGDLGPEGLLFIPKEQCVYGRNLLVVSNEISGTVSFFEVKVDEIANGSAQLQIFEWDNPPSIGSVNNDEVHLGGVSGLAKNWNEDNAFYAISDRGPIFGAGENPLAFSSQSELALFSNHHPQLLHFQCIDENLALLEQDTIFDDGEAFVGLPSQSVSFGDEVFEIIGATPLFSVKSLDPEAISFRGDGRLVIANENESSILALENNELQQSYLPFEFNGENNLLDSALLKVFRQEGIKALSCLPNGNMIFTTSASLKANLDGERSALHRVYEVSPQGEQINVFAYESDTHGDGYSSVTDLKAINNNELLVLESYHKGDFVFEDLYLISLDPNFALSNLIFEGQPLEAFENASDLEQNGEQVLDKSHFLDLIEYNWEKSWVAEGLTLLNDSTILLVNDNQYGLASPLNDGVTEFTDMKTHFFKLVLNTPLNLVSPICPVSIVGPTIACEGDSIVLNVSDGFETWEWSTGQENETLTLNTSQTVEITATSQEGCVARLSTDIVFNPIPVYESLEDLVICPDSSINIQFPEVEGLDFSWIGLEEETLFLQYTELPLGQLSFPFEVSTMNNCTQNDTLHLEVRPELDSPLDSFYGFCEGDSLILQLEGFSAVFWSNGDEGPQTWFSEQGTSNVTFIDEFTCSGSQDFFIIEHPSPTLDLGDDWEICEGETLILNAGAFEEVLWSTGSTSPFISIDESGDYGVEVMDANACYAIDSVNVNVVFCAGIEENDLELSMFPNPADKILHLLNPSSASEYELRNMQGVLIQKGELLLGENEIDISLLSKGVYLIVVSSQSQRWTSRFIKS
jgi:hypothetical protein